MTENTERPQPEPQYLYNIDQKVSANAYFDADVDGEAVRFQVTTRHGATSEQIAATTERLIEAYKMLRGKFPKSDKAMPVETKPQEHPAPDGKKPFEQRPVPVDQLPPDLPTGSAEGGNVDYFKDEFDRIKITPEPDEKATVLFYKGKLEFPVGARINKWKNATVIQHLAPLGEFDPTKAQEVNVAGEMYWTIGSEYVIKNGPKAGQKSHYKDLRLIQAIE